MCAISYPKPFTLNLLVIQHWLPFPSQPRHSDDHLNGPGNPQRDRHAHPRPLQPGAQDAAGDHQDDGRHAPVPLDVAPQGRQDLGVGEQVAVERGQDVCRHLVEAQDAAGDDLAAELEGQEGQRGVGHAVRLVALEDGVGGGGAEARHVEGGRDGALRQCGRDEDEDRLDEEGEGEGGLAPGPNPARLTEEEAARPEGRDGDEGLEPQGGGAVREVGRAKGQEDGIT